MSQNVASLPTARWLGGESPSRAKGENTWPGAWDWQRLIQEWTAMQDLLLLLYANVAESSTITNVTAETAFDVSYTLPAATLQIGDVLRIKVRGIAPTTNSTDTLAIKLYIGSIVLATIAATDVADNNEFYIEAELFVTAAALVLVKGLKTTLAAPASWTFSHYALAAQAVTIANANLIKATATWSVASASNIVKLTQMDVKRERYLAAS